MCMNVHVLNFWKELCCLVCEMPCFNASKHIRLTDSVAISPLSYFDLISYSRYLRDVFLVTFVICDVVAKKHAAKG